MELKWLKTENCGLTTLKKIMLQSEASLDDTKPNELGLELFENIFLATSNVQKRITDIFLVTENVK